MSKTMTVAWGRVRPGMAVRGADGNDHRVVTVEPRGADVSVLFWDGMRELHHQDARAQVRLQQTTDQRAW